MKFSDFLLIEEQDDLSSTQINKYIINILNSIKNDNKDIIVLNALYTTEYKNKNDILKNDKIDGYFVYNKNDPGDNNFYTGSFSYTTKNDDVEVSLETSDPYPSISDVDFFIKNSLKAFKI